MIVLAILSTLAAAAFSIATLFANSMASSPQPFRGGALLISIWLGVGVMWLAWWLN
jgi:hypothetical protein